MYGGTPGGLDFINDRDRGVSFPNDSGPEFLGTFYGEGVVVAGDVG